MTRGFVTVESHRLDTYRMELIALPKLIVVTRAGVESEVEATSGLSVMENIRAAGFDELVALCGGCCACATCHVVVDEPWSDQAGSMGEDEDELLDSSENRAPTSRLSCQIAMTDTLDGLRVTIAPEE